MNPAPSRLGPSTVARGQRAEARYRLLVYTGAFDKELVARRFAELK